MRSPVFSGAAVTAQKLARVLPAVPFVAQGAGSHRALSASGAPSITSFDGGRRVLIPSGICCRGSGSSAGGWRAEHGLEFPDARAQCAAVRGYCRETCFEQDCVSSRRPAHVTGREGEKSSLQPPLVVPVDPVCLQLEDSAQHVMCVVRDVQQTGRAPAQAARASDAMEDLT